MRFRRDGASSKRAMKKEEASAAAASSGGLLSVTTGFAAPAASTKATAVVQQKQRQLQQPKTKMTSQKRSSQKSSGIRHTPSADDEMLMNAFDNDHGITTSVQPKSKQSHSPKRSLRATSPPQQSRASVYQSHVTALTNLQHATAKLQQQMAAWQERAIVCGRAALKAKKEDSTGNVIITNECKLQLLRRKLLKLNIANAERQLIQLELTQHELETAIRKLQPQTVKEEKNESSIVVESATGEDNDDILLPLEKELEHVDVVQEILSKDLKADLMSDDVSEVEYDEEELLQELRLLALSDNGSVTSRSERSHQDGRQMPNNRRQASQQCSTKASSKTKTARKNHEQKSGTSFKATLF